MDYGNSNFINQVILIFPIFLTILVILKFVSAYIFSHIEFKTQTFRYLKYYSINDALLLLTLMLLPISLCKEVCNGWWTNNYWLIFYRLYINLFISRSLHTANSILGITIAFIQYRDLNDYKVPSKNYLFIVFSSIIFSISLNLPIVFLYNIEVPLNSTTSLYSLKLIRPNALQKLFGVQFSIGFIILFLTLIFNLILVVKIKQQKKSQFRSIIFTSKKQRNCEFTVLKNKRDADIEIVSCVEQRPRNYSSHNESKTKLLAICITVAFSIDQIFKTICGKYFCTFARF